MSEKGRKATIWSMTYTSLLMASLFQSFAQTMMSTVIPLRADDMGATAQIVGAVNSAFALTALLARPFLGPAFDAFSKKRIGLLASSVIAASIVMYSFSANVNMLFAARLLHGLGIACSAPILMAMAGDSLPEEKMGTGLSIYGLAYAMASAVGPALGIYLIDLVGYEWSFRLAAGMVVLSFLILLFLKEPGAKTRKPYKLSLSRIFTREALLPSFLCMITSVPFTCITAFVAIYGNLRGVDGIGCYFTVYAVALLATRPIYGTLADRYGYIKIIPMGLACLAASLLAIASADNLALFIIAAVVGAFGYGAILPLLQSLAFLRSPSDLRGAASNTNYAGLDIGNLLGPVLGGSAVCIFTDAGMSLVSAYSWMFMLAASLVVLVLVLFVLIREKLR